MPIEPRMTTCFVNYIVKVRQGLESGERQSAFNRIKSKHVDFVACDPDTLDIMFVIELDDRSHEREDRSERDEFVDAALEDSGVPIVRFPVRKSYSAQEIRSKLPGGGR